MRPIEAAEKTPAVGIPARDMERGRRIADSGPMPRTADDNALGAFLRACRDRVSPEQAGLSPVGDRRRVGGLRREELALLAGVSASYLTRLEQGHSRRASAQVLDALASALRLDDTERAHLRALGQGDTPVRRRRRPAERPDAALLELLRGIPSVPALIVGRHNDVLAWNPLGHGLLAGHLDPAAPDDPATRPNLTRLTFLDPESRALYADWPRKARAVVGNLRLTAARHPEDVGLAELIGTLSMASTTFSALWSDQRVQPCATAVYELRHPTVGTLSVTQQTLRGADAAGQSLITHTTSPGSPSADALALLGQLGAGEHAPGDDRDRPGAHGRSAAVTPPPTGQRSPGRG